LSVPYFKPQKVHASPFLVDVAHEIGTDSSTTNSKPLGDSSTKTITPPTEAFVVTVSRKDVRVYLEPSSTRIAKLEMSTRILQAGIIFIQGKRKSIPFPLSF